MSSILCIGEALIDMICTDKGKSLTVGEHFLKKPGGAPTNVAAAIAALGGKVELAAKVGIDPFGEHLVETMREFGVGTRYMLRDERHFTTFAFVSLMENGERDFYFNRGADGQFTEAEAEAIDLADVSIIHFGSATGFLPGPLQAAYRKLLHRALERNISVSFDPNYRHLLFGNNIPSFVEQSWYFLERCHFFKLSDEEALLITGAPTLEAATRLLLERTRAIFAITLGKEGTLLGMNRQTLIIPSIPVQPVDTTGAGDAFVGAVLFQLSESLAAGGWPADEESWTRMVSNANKAGARTCEFMGAMEAFRHLSGAIFR